MIVTKIKTTLCKGCGFCIHFCPKKILEFSDERNKKGIFCARIVDQDACIACLQCARICPEGAIEIEKGEE